MVLGSRGDWGAGFGGDVDVTAATTQPERPTEAVGFNAQDI